jgi:ribonuclease HI
MERNITGVVMSMLDVKLNEHFGIKPYTLYLATDGGATKNGKPGCVCSWAYFLRVGAETEFKHIHGSGKITDKASNNIGELTAVLKGLQALQEYIAANACDTKYTVVVYSDSMYAINCITKWYPKWVATHKTGDKKNLDLIKTIHDIWKTVCSDCDIKFEHVRSHKVNDNTLQWHLNDIVDKMCGELLK